LSLALPCAFGQLSLSEMRTFLLLLVAYALTASSFAGNTINAPYPTQLDGQTGSFATKFTQFDIPSDTKIRSLIVTVTFYRVENPTNTAVYSCLSPSGVGYGLFAELSMSLSLSGLTGTPILATDILSPAAGYGNIPSSANYLSGLVVQTFVVATGQDGLNSIDNQLYPTTNSAYYTPHNGFTSFTGMSLRNTQFNLNVADATPNFQYTCLSQYEVTVNCVARAVIYRQPTFVGSPVTGYIIAVGTGGGYTSPLVTTLASLTTEQYYPLQSTITNVAVTIAWTKNAATGTCATFQTINGAGDRLLEDIQATVTYTPLSSSGSSISPITVILVNYGSWHTLTNVTESDFFSTTFDSTSYVFYPTSMVGGTVQPFQSLSVFNGLTAWGTWAVNIYNSDSTNPLCVFGVRVAVQTCSINSSCLCGTEVLSSGANQNSVVGITTGNAFI